MISSATTKPKIAVPSARAAPSSRLVWILPEASGWRLMASVALPGGNADADAAADTSQRCDTSAQSYESVHNYFSF